MTLELQGIGVARGIAIGRAHILFHNQGKNAYAATPANIS